MLKQWLDYHGTCTAVESGCNMFGVKGRSILSLVSKCDLVISNYMHAVLLGVLQQFIFSWCDSASNCRPYYLGRQMSTLDAALLQIKPPSTIKTAPSLSLSYFSQVLERLQVEEFPAVEVSFTSGILSLLLCAGVFYI